MNQKKIFCEECRKDVAYITKEKQMSGIIRGTCYKYVGKEAKCAKCGAYVDVKDITDANLKALYDVYRDENGIVSLEKIQAIPKRYAIGKRPLSILLGWGEHTFTRYAYGDIPTKQYSETLNHLFDNPKYYLQILEENKECLHSSKSYRKSYEAVTKLIENKTDCCGKINDVINYLLNQCEDITPLALQKSLYYIQGFFYAFYGSFMFAEDCEAWAHGPVYRDIYFRYADYHFDPIAKTEAFDSSIFTSEEKAILDSVIKNICCYSGKVLETFTHNESPWINARGNLPQSASSDKIIDREMIADYFVKIKARYRMSEPADIKLYIKDMFAKIL